ncbi:MAG: DNA repair protein RecN [Gemmatimonadales bacterium]
MLAELRVRDLAVIADVTLPLQPGLNVLSGETGAGKSMLVDALALLLGERASADVVRPGAQRTIIEGAFEFTPTASSRLLPPLTALGVEVDDGRLVLKREISGEGRSRAWVNGSPTTVGVLAQLGALLADLHGQHVTQSLLRAAAQRDVLDAYGDAGVERVAVRDAHERLRELERRDQSLVDQRADVRRKADYLGHVVQEIGRAAPQVGEEEALETEAQRLAHADELGRLGRELEQALDTAGLARAAKLVTALRRLDPSTGQWQELLDGAFANVEELAQAARDYAAGIEADPGRLAAVEERRDALFRLRQKYGPTLPDVLATRDRAAKELELLDTAELDLHHLAELREAAAAEFTRACAALTGKRQQGATRLARAVSELLPALGMPGGRFAIRLVPLPAPRSQGAEEALFEVQLSLGLDSRPLAKVASGGELSRLMLALKVVLAEHDAVPTLVFDEVDQGIGGEVGGRVGEALAAVARGQGGAGGGGGAGGAGRRS